MGSTNIFYKYYEEKYTYKDLYLFFYSFVKILGSFKKKQNKICTLSNKSFNFYACVVSILLSNNIWIPISSSFPTKRLIKILSILKPEIIFCDNQSLKNYKIRLLKK